VEFAKSITLLIRIVDIVKSAMNARRAIMSNYLREQIDRKKKEIEMQKQASNVYTIHPPKSELILFYEVVEAGGENTWGGADAGQAIQWLTRAPVGSRLLVSAWDSDEEDAHLVGQTLDITEIVKAASL
jgi:hypothetical protein